MVCCEQSEETQRYKVMAIAILHIALSGITLTLMSITLASTIYLYFSMDPSIFNPDQDLSEEMSSKAVIATFQKYKIYAGIKKGLLWLLMNFLWFVQSIELFLAVKKMKWWRSYSWFICQVVVLIFSIVMMPVEMAMIPSGNWFWMQLISSLIIVSFIMYGIRIVWRFIKESQRVC